MRCGQCAAELSRSVRFCARCGAPAAHVTETASDQGPRRAAERMHGPGRRRWFAAAAAIALLAGAGSVAVSQRGDGRQFAGRSPPVAPFHEEDKLGTVRWRAPLRPVTWWASPVVAVGDTVVVSHEGALHGMDPDSGEVRWRRAFDWADPRRSLQPVVIGGHLLVEEERTFGGSAIRSLDPESGLDRWVVEESGSSRLLAAERSVYLLARPPDPDRLRQPGGLELVRLDPATGEATWRRTIDGGSPTAASDAAVVFIRGHEQATSNGSETRFEASVLDGRTGEEFWRQSLGVIGGDVLTAPVEPYAVAGGGTVVFVDTAGRLRAHDVATGEPLWEAAAADPRRIRLIDDLVVERGEGGHIVARDLLTGERRWVSEERFLSQVPLNLYGDRTLVVPYGGARLTAIDLDDGTTRWVVRQGTDDAGAVIDGSFVTASGPSGDVRSPGSPTLAAFDLASGHARWSVVLPFRTGFDIVGGRGWVGLVDGRRGLRARDSTTGVIGPVPSISGAVTSLAKGAEGTVLIAWRDAEGREHLSAVQEGATRWSLGTALRWHVRVPPRSAGYPWCPRVQPVFSDGLAVLAADHALHAYDRADGDLVATTELPAALTCLAGTPHGVLVTTADDSLTLFPAAGGDPRASPAGIRRRLASRRRERHRLRSGRSERARRRRPEGRSHRLAA